MTLWFNTADNSIHDDMNGEALSLPSWPKGMSPITQAEANAILNPPLNETQIAENIRLQAHTLLTTTDSTFLRIQESIVLGLTTNTDPVVVSWINYRKALRVIVSSATATSVLPVKPTSYPAGT